MIHLRFSTAAIALIAAMYFPDANALLQQDVFRSPVLPCRIQMNLSSRPADEFVSPIRNVVEIGTSEATAETLLQVTATATAEDQQQSFTPFQLGVRATAALATSSYMTNPDLLDNAISSIYSVIYNWDAASEPLFEAKVAVLGFLIPIIGFSSLHLLLGQEKTKASRFDGQMPTRPFEWADVKGWNLAYNPVTAYLGSIWIYHQFVHPHASLPELAPTFGVFAIELIFGVCLYDLLFFPLHYLMHKSKWGEMRKIHGYHHRVNSHSLNALETVQHSYLDGFLQVAVNILVQQISPFGGFGHKHSLSRLAHNVVVTYLLTEAHSGYDLPWMSHRIFPEFLGGSPRHEKHHHDGRVYYQQYFKYLDDFFGFTQEEQVVFRKKIKEPTAAAPTEDSSLVRKEIASIS
jgi:sterol desaturase/sphingolipid hydroxylase (fatty acid hydroxylase superfamily)